MRKFPLPWFDRTGNFSFLRLGVFVAVVLPALWIAWQASANMLGPRPLTEAIHQSGQWAVRLLAATLAVTPLRHATRWNKLISIRRMLGLSVFAYALLHLLLYIWDQHGDLLHVASEIVLRIYLTIGFVALAGLCLLAATSFDAAIRRLGAARWNRIHQVVYVIAVLGAVHFFLQSKLDVTEAVIMGGVYALLLAERLARRVVRDLSPVMLLAVTAAAAMATACAEAAYYVFKTGAPFLEVLGANLDFSYTVRPAWYVVGAGLVLVAARLARPLFTRAKLPARTAAPRRPAPAQG